MQFINAKFDELEIFVELLITINFKFSIFCVQDTWKSENDYLSQFSLQGYKLIGQIKNCSNKGVLIIYVDKQYNYSVKMNINMYEHWEELILQITGSNLLKTITIDNIYRPTKIM